MSAENAWPVLSSTERRLLGVLVEKAKTTPENYPLSVNALVTGANQKSNREPVMELADAEVEQALADLQHKGLVTRITGGRVERWRHNLYDHWTSEKVELAILAELLLRGPQTEGELRGRASRMEPIADLDTLRGVLRPMVERKLVLFLGPAGRRGTLIAHGFHSTGELDKARAGVVAEDAEPARMQTVAPAADEIAELREMLRQLRQAHETLAQEFRAFRSSLGS